MVCPKCGSENVNAQVVNQVKLKNTSQHGIFWWLFVSWWWIPIKWLLFTIPALIGAFSRGKNKKIKNTVQSMFVCQDCGHTWASGSKSGEMRTKIDNYKAKK